MHRRREVTVSAEAGYGLRTDVAIVVDRLAADYEDWGVGFNVSSGTGFWSGVREDSVTVRFDWPKDDDASGETMFGFLLRRLAQDIRYVRLAHVTEYDVSFSECDLDQYRPAPAKFGSIPAQATPPWPHSSATPSFANPWGPRL